MRILKYKIMEIIWIERKQETDNYYITKAKFKTFFGKKFTATCITEKKGLRTRYFRTGRLVRIRLWTSFIVFLESDLNYMHMVGED